MAVSSATIPVRSEAVGVSLGANPVILLGRFLFVLTFLLSAPTHFSSQTIVYAASQGVPLASLALPLSGVIALAGGLSILLGYRARIGAGLIVLFLAAVTPMLHKFWAVSDPKMRQMQFIMFMKNVSRLGGALLITKLGPGPWSLDAQRKWNRGADCPPP